MNLYYILEGKTPKPCNDLKKWAKYLDNANRNVDITFLTHGIRISTVFLGLDNSLIGSDIPILFETMIFGGKHDLYQERYATWEQADKGHKIAVKLAKKDLNLWQKIINLFY